MAVQIIPDLGPAANGQGRPEQVLESIDEFENAQRVPDAAADVEGLALNRIDLPTRSFKRCHEILDEQCIANLHAIAIDRDGLALHRSTHEMSDPTLILVAVLMRAIDAAHAKDRRAQTIAA